MVKTQFSIIMVEAFGEYYVYFVFVMVMSLVSRLTPGFSNLKSLAKSEFLVPHDEPLDDDVIV